MPLVATCLAPFLAAPVARLGYAVPSTGQVLSCNLDLPLVFTKFCSECSGLLDRELQACDGGCRVSGWARALALPIE